MSVFDVDAYLAEQAAAGTLVDQSQGRGDVVPLPEAFVAPWRALVAASLERGVLIPVPAQIIPSAILEKAEGNRATELGRTLRSHFSHPEAEGGDGTAVWVSVLDSDAEKGKPMRLKATDRVSSKAAAYKRLLEAGRISADGRFVAPTA